MVQQLAPQLWMKLGRSYITVAIHNCLVPWVIYVCSERGTNCMERATATRFGPKRTNRGWRHPSHRLVFGWGSLNQDDYSNCGKYLIYFRAGITIGIANATVKMRI